MLTKLITAGRLTTGTPNNPSVVSLADFDKNGIGLPDNGGGAIQTGLSMHSGPHRHYSNFIASLLDEAGKDIDIGSATPAQLDLVVSRVEKIMAFSQTLLAGLEPGGAAALNAADPNVPNFPHLSARKELEEKRAWVASNWEQIGNRAIAGGIDNLIDPQLYDLYRSHGVFDPQVSAADRALRVRDAQSAYIPHARAALQAAQNANAPAAVADFWHSEPLTPGSIFSTVRYGHDAARERRQMTASYMNRSQNLLRNVTALPPAFS